MRSPAALGAAACLCLAACLPAERLNDACRWTHDTDTLAPPGDPARRAHLVEDVRVARWLGVRHADVVRGRVFDDAYRAARDRCTAASLAEVARRHGVTRAELTAATGAREPWIDLLAVFVPMAWLFAAVGRHAARRIAAGYDPGDRAVAAAVLAGLTPIAGGLGLGITQMWAWLVETVRIRDGHISYRVTELPAYQHPWLVWGVATAMFAVIAARVVMGGRHPTSDIRHPTSDGCHPARRGEAASAGIYSPSVMSSQATTK